MFKKPVLGYYHGQIVQSKVNSFRKPLQVKDESSATKKLCASVSKGTKPNSVKTSNATKSYKASNMTAATTLENLTSQNTQLVRPPNRNHHSNTQHKAKQDISRTSANVTVPKNPTEKEQLQSETVLGIVKSSSSQGTKNKALQSKTVLPVVKTSSQDVKRSKTLSQNTSENIARPISFPNIKLTEKSKTVDH